MTDTKTSLQLDRIQRIALIAGLLGLAISGAGFWASRAQFFLSYLLGFVFWAGLALGCFAVLLLHHTFGAGWGFVIQRTLEAGTRTFPLVAVLFLPLLLGLHDLYEWAHVDAVAADPILRHKQPYLNVGFFIARAAFYFAAWIGVSTVLNQWSKRLDATGDPRLAARLRNAGPPGLLVYGLTATFAMVDWVMSLDPHWFSTMFGLMFIAGQVLATIAFATLIARLLSDGEPISGFARPAHFHDLGNLLLAFTMIWAYLSFSQFLIIWSGNAPETITFYKARSSGGWEWIALVLVAFGFALPFVILLSRQTKRRIRVLAVVAAIVLVMRFVDLFWVLTPTLHPGRLTLHGSDLAAPIGIGGIWLAFFIHQLKRRPLLPQGDPRMKEAPAHGG